MHKFQLRQFIKIREAKENNHKFANRKMRLELETFPNSLSIFRLREIFTHNIITQGTANKKSNYGHSANKTPNRRTHSMCVRTWGFLALDVTEASIQELL